MALLLDELIRSVELWLKVSKKQQPLVDPDLDPVLLVPGIAGSILHAVDDDGKEERVWVRILGADHEFRTKLWSRFDPSTGQTVSLDTKTKIVVPEDRYGLYAIDTLDPDMIIGCECVYYYHDLIEEMIKLGYQEGKTLFGFGYDFRQSNRLQETMDKFSAKLESIHASSGGKKINIITHSMGGLLVKCFMCLHGEIFEKYVKTWIAIAAPFQGAPGYITASLLNGTSFVEGWEQNFFISKWSMHQLLIECPSIYELMGNPNFSWDVTPLLQIWREKDDGNGGLRALLESYEPMEALDIVANALSSNTVVYNGLQLPLPLNLEILQWANKTREILSSAKLPASVKFYNIYGISCDTAHSVCYGSELTPISDLKQLLPCQSKYICVNGDGTVAAESAKADGLNALARVGVPADHRGIICDRHVFRILKHWLKAGEPDPFYNPLNDYVILPTAFEIERHSEENKEVASVKEEWEIISSNCDNSTELPPLIRDLSVNAYVDGKEQSLEEAHATIVVHPQSNGVQNVELRAVSVATVV
ncbi:Lecithin:cholesterol/phospholipid:diacylglycerol acyltransferase protein [Dioscorea alata]|uniref:Lecithin:cholesterol/phospholipid:diacylglycerol acyltransferase protein n=1 Tax=Dioscorea alata TaxID=55571 RepID=A0ACB7UMM0_DIOAL|nr:Lecithin:cholesterol/phospholipid:diacylglycerol acyltransferase protein [Dioscorea alata]